jgi:hypothetical protein
MRAPAKIAATAVAISLLTACAGRSLIAPDDRKHICQIAVDEKFGSPVFHANPLYNPAGGLIGAAVGAMAGLFPSPLAIFTVPMYAGLGAEAGTACATASLSHPNAEADFENILKPADAGTLKRALEADLNASQAGCGVAQANASLAVPDTIIEINKVDVRMLCTSEEQEYRIVVTWRALNAANHRVLAETLTNCRQTSILGVSAWFADPDRARVEIERVLAKTGQRMAAQLLSPVELPECKFRSGKTGEIEEK